MFEKGTSVRLKSFLGELSSEIDDSESYWKLIGEKGKIIEIDSFDEERFLILFEKDLDALKLENHNPIKNSLWIKKTDLELDHPSIKKSSEYYSTGINIEIILAIIALSIAFFWLVFSILVIRKLSFYNLFIGAFGIIMLILGIYKRNKIKNNDLDF